jgi:hypothetical protein
LIVKGGFEMESAKIDIHEIFKKLSEPLPEESIQRTKKTETRKGYDTTGHGCQFCINRFNEVLADKWGSKWEILEKFQGTYKNGFPFWDICVKCDIWILDKNNIRDHVGGHIAVTFSDALKGAITNAFKKTAALWGVGRQAYEGTLDDDNEAYPDSPEQMNKPNQNQSFKPQNIKENKVLKELMLKANKIKWQKIMYHQWIKYVCTHFKVDDMEQLSDEQIKELDANLNWTNTEERVKKYEKGILEVLNSAVKKHDDFPGPPPHEEAIKIRTDIKSIMSQIYGKNQQEINKQISTMTVDKSHDLDKMDIGKLKEVLDCTNILLSDYNEKLKEKQAQVA